MKRVKKIVVGCLVAIVALFFVSCVAALFAEPSETPTPTPTVEAVSPSPNAPEVTPKPTPEATPVATPEPTPEPDEPEPAGTDYILNTNSKKFHYPSCGSAKKISEKNKGYFTGTRDELIAKGYSPCGNCDH